MAEHSVGGAEQIKSWVSLVRHVSWCLEDYRADSSQLYPNSVRHEW